jgi:hypothetical protein
MEFPPSEEPSRNRLSAQAIDEALKGILAEGHVIPLPMRDDAESMRPTLQPGQMFEVRQAGKRPRRGDLLLFRGADDRVVHRYLGPARKRDGAPRLRMRGDANPMLDPPLDPVRVLGRVIAIERDGEWLDLDSASARLYGLGAALHDLFWAVAARAGGKFDKLIGQPDGTLRRLIVASDRGLLAAAHWLYLRFARRREGGGEPSGRAASKPGPGASAPR